MPTQFKVMNQVSAALTKGWVQAGQFSIRILFESEQPRPQIEQLFR